MMLEPYGGAIADVQAWQNAFIHRDVDFNIPVDVFFNNPEEEADALKFLGHSCRCWTSTGTAGSTRTTPARETRITGKTTGGTVSTASCDQAKVRPEELLPLRTEHLARPPETPALRAERQTRGRRGRSTTNRTELRRAGCFGQIRRNFHRAADVGGAARRGYGAARVVRVGRGTGRAWRNADGDPAGPDLSRPGGRFSQAVPAPRDPFQGRRRHDTAGGAVSRDVGPAGNQLDGANSRNAANSHTAGRACAVARTLVVLGNGREPESATAYRIGCVQLRRARGSPRSRPRAEGVAGGKPGDERAGAAGLRRPPHSSRPLPGATAQAGARKDRRGGNRSGQRQAPLHPRKRPGVRPAECRLLSGLSGTAGTGSGRAIRRGTHPRDRPAREPDPQPRHAVVAVRHGDRRMARHAPDG